MNTVTLPAICDRAAARALYPELCDSIGPERLSVNASAVERTGQAMLQVLASAATTESGISIEEPSEPFVKAIKLAGLETILGSDNQETGAA
ncbi:STAS domain-containing protein [Erythrobacter sp. SCSIO 43205]|uniref:STAS domain-containing protein n=1 Tax=Erythrobacter sp. SCSIO 43205 TaxID=2779361 RepID=UPI001CA81D3A|nr:STAS domain-containing protein [Erythrobacter sp. SCSIO 43205]UAB79555.1 STAS domain-containing protein [Erythrobacter sp. SCSIO 43205]